MLVIGRKRDEKLIIDGNIEITILRIGRNHVKFGVEAPREVLIRTRSGEGAASPEGSGERSARAAAGANPVPPDR